MLDLHGNSNKREKCPDGSKDENVFDITQGVAIAFFVKHGNGEAHVAAVTLIYGRARTNMSGWSKIISSTLIGALCSLSLVSTSLSHWMCLMRAYDGFVSVNDIFPLNTVGIVTRDSLTISWSRGGGMGYRVFVFHADPGWHANIRARHGLSGMEGRSSSRRSHRIRTDRDRIMPILYRSFDKRHTPLYRCRAVSCQATPLL